MAAEIPPEIMEHSYANTSIEEVVEEDSSSSDSSSSESSSSSDEEVEEPTSKLRPRGPPERHVDSYSASTPKTSPGNKLRSPKRLSTSVGRKAKEPLRKRRGEKPRASTGSLDSLRTRSSGVKLKSSQAAWNRLRYNACGKCEGCKREDCGKCVYCKDKVKYGGPGKKKQKCVLRHCKEMPIRNKQVVAALEKLKNSSPPTNSSSKLQTSPPTLKQTTLTTTTVKSRSPSSNKSTPSNTPTSTKTATSSPGAFDQTTTSATASDETPEVVASLSESPETPAPTAVAPPSMVSAKASTSTPEAPGSAVSTTSTAASIESPTSSGAAISTPAAVITTSVASKTSVSAPATTKPLSPNSASVALSNLAKVVKSIRSPQPFHGPTTINVVPNPAASTTTVNTSLPKLSVPAIKFPIITRGSNPNEITVGTALTIASETIAKVLQATSPRITPKNTAVKIPTPAKIPTLAVNKPPKDYTVKPDQQVSRTTPLEELISKPLTPTQQLANKLASFKQPASKPTPPLQTPSGKPVPSTGLPSSKPAPPTQRPASKSATPSLGGSKPAPTETKEPSTQQRRSSLRVSTPSYKAGAGWEMIMKCEQCGREKNLSMARTDRFCTRRCVMQWLEEHPDKTPKDAVGDSNAPFFAVPSNSSAPTVKTPKPNTSKATVKTPKSVPRALKNLIIDMAAPGTRLNLSSDSDEEEDKDKTNASSLIIPDPNKRTRFSQPASSLAKRSVVTPQPAAIKKVKTIEKTRAVSPSQNSKSVKFDLDSTSVSTVVTTPPPVRFNQSSTVPGSISIVPLDRLSDFVKEQQKKFEANTNAAKTEVKIPKGLTRDVPSWSVADVCTYFKATADCAEFGTIFKQQEMDGFALLKLTDQTMYRCLGLPLGKVIKVMSHIEELKKLSQD